MTWHGEPVTFDGVEERALVVERAGRPVPGVVWSPVDRPAERLLLLGHGGTAHKRVEYLVEVAKLAAGHGIAALAIDGPAHGDRAHPDLASGLDAFEEGWRRGGGTAGIVGDWRAALDFVEIEHGPRPTGWWGLSMGTMMGLPLVAADERISIAVLGLMGVWGPNGDDLERLAPDVSCPLRFLVQWDDELVPRQACLDLFDRLGSRRKTLHANPGSHAAVPTFEVVASVGYLDAHLG